MGRGRVIGRGFVFLPLPPSAHARAVQVCAHARWAVAQCHGKRKRTHHQRRGGPSKAQQDSSWTLHTISILERSAEQQMLPEAALAGFHAARTALARLAQERQRCRGEPFAPPAVADAGSEPAGVEGVSLRISGREYSAQAEMTVYNVPVAADPDFGGGCPVQVPCCLHFRCAVFSIPCAHLVAVTVYSRTQYGIILMSTLCLVSKCSQIYSPLKLHVGPLQLRASS